MQPASPSGPGSHAVTPTPQGHAALRARAEDWLAGEIDEGDARTVRAWLAADDAEALERACGERLEFGTAGIRGRVGPGPGQMNRSLVVRVTAGVAARLREEAAGGLIVVGRDARHGSQDFAADAAAVLAAAGFRVQAFDPPVPTPLLAFATRHLGAVAGVQITASHNPPQDNGYKLYWRGGAQIAAPLDVEISAAIDRVGPARDVPRDPAAVRTADLAAVQAAYTAAALSHVRFGDERELRIVTSALHGVAGAPLVALLAAAGFHDVHPVLSQQEPDPDFPTVEFPNPEEPGALDQALAQAAALDADLLLANDPDGDRIAVAVPDGQRWRLLSGDEVGCLLGEHLLACDAAPSQAAVATTVVSSQLLARIAAHHGAACFETLTGFKWLAAAALRAMAQSRRMVLAYEQALGVMVGTAVLDKDGMSAAAVVADLAAHRKAVGGGLPDLLDDLARRHGLHVTAQRSVRLGPDDAPLVETVLRALRERPPSTVADVAVTGVADHVAGVRRSPDGREERIDLPPTALVVLLLADGTRLQIRPSGTEPLLKLYGEVVQPVAADLPTARAAAAARLQAVMDAFADLALAPARR